jgi:DNA helicase HerA-like ATPase
VLGTTGSGKSCAVTVILKALLRESQHARILLLDPHNEYAQAFGSVAQCLDPTSTLELPYWLFNFDELCEVVIGDDELHSAQATILGDAIVDAKQKFVNFKSSFAITVDTPTPYWMSDVMAYLQQAQGKLTRSEPIPAYARLASRLKKLANDSRYSFMFGRAAAGDNMKTLLSKLFRIPVDGKPVTITDLSGIPSEILNVVVSVLCRLTLDFALWSDRSFPILIVCEEAHRYVPRDTSLGFEPTKRTLARIAKEGRKYGVSLCVVSQRPSDLAQDILSECNTIFALRMNNQEDQDFIRATMSDSGLGLLEFLPSLRAGEAITIGEGVTIPQRLTFLDLPANEMPRGKSSSFTAAWNTEQTATDAIGVAIERWRNLHRNTPPN